MNALAVREAPVAPRSIERDRAKLKRRPDRSPSTRVRHRRERAPDIVGDAVDMTEQDRAQYLIFTANGLAG